MWLCVGLMHVPLAVVVHAVKAVPLCVELREGVSNLSHLSRRSIPNGIRLPLMDPCNLLTQMLQIHFDILGKDKNQHREEDKSD